MSTTPRESPRRFFLAIRHIPSGGFLPSAKGYGFTREEPTLLKPPRLFEKIGPAKQALSRWLEGEHYEQEIDDDNEIRIAVVRRADRSASLMEIVEIELIARTFSEARLRIL